MTIKRRVTHCGTNDSCLFTILFLPPHSTQCLRCSGHHCRFSQCLSRSVNRFTINVLSINASAPTFEGLFGTYNRSSNTSMSVDGSSGRMEMVSVNIPAGVFRTVDLLRTFLSAAPISPHLCLSVTLQTTNALHTTATAFYTTFGLPAWLIIPEECLPIASTAVTALPTLLSNNASSIPHAHLTSAISDVVYLTCLYTQLVQMFTLLNHLVLGDRAHIQTIFI